MHRNKYWFESIPLTATVFRMMKRTTLLADHLITVGDLPGSTPQLLMLSDGVVAWSCPMFSPSLVPGSDTVFLVETEESGRERILPPRPAP
jgi:hypothetical protein